MSTHPRTDKVSTPHIGFYSCATVPSSFAAELETENESLKKEIETLKTKIVNQCDRIRYLEGATSHACGTPLSIALRERDEAREAAERWESSSDAMERAGAEQARRADENREWALKAERERDDARNAFTIATDEMVKAQSKTREISMKLQTELSELKLHNSNLQMSNIRLNNLLCEHGILEYGN